MRLSFDFTGATLHPLCPTGCTAEAISLESVLHNREALLQTWISTAVGNDGVTCLEVTSKASGIHVKLETFDLFYLP